MDKEARAKHQEAMDEIAKDPQTASTLATIQEWREAEIKAINTSTSGIRWLASTAISLAVVAIAVTLSFGILGLVNTNSAHEDNTATRNKVDNVLTLAQGAICSQSPQSQGCPPPKPGQAAAAQSAQSQIVNRILQGQIDTSKENCVAAAIQQSIISGIPASVLDDACDAIK